MLEAIAAFLIGLLIGSFLNVCIYRWPRDMSVVRPRSFCPACDAPIVWHDNIPVISYLLLGGRCRQCRARIPLRYPVVELLTAVSFFVTVLTLGPGLVALKWCLFEALALGLLFSDLEQRILPDEMTLGGAVAGILLSLVVPMEWGYAHLLSATGMSDRSVSVHRIASGCDFGQRAVVADRVSLQRRAAQGGARPRRREDDGHGRFVHGLAGGLADADSGLAGGLGDRASYTSGWRKRTTPPTNSPSAPSWERSPSCWPCSAARSHHRRHLRGPTFGGAC